MNKKNKNIPSRVPCFIITDPNGLPFDGAKTPVYFKKMLVQTRSEELTTLKIPHLIIDITLRDANGLLSKDFTKRYI